jgi:hypothetical protein
MTEHKILDLDIYLKSKWLLTNLRKLVVHSCSGPIQNSMIAIHKEHTLTRLTVQPQVCCA